MDNLILVGFSCSGKTTLGRNVARRLRLDFIDSDRLIEEMTGKTIPDIFREDGEPAFHEHLPNMSLHSSFRCYAIHPAIAIASYPRNSVQ